MFPLRETVSPEFPPSLSLMPSAVGAAWSAREVVPDPDPLPVPDPGPPPPADLEEEEGGFGVGGATVVDTSDARSISGSAGLRD